MKRAISILAAVLVIGGIVYVSWHSKVEAPGEEFMVIKQYTSSEYGLSFSYPSDYYLEEKNIKSGGTRFYHQIILTEDTEENRMVREGKTEARDGPSNITMEIFGNIAEKQSAEDFIKNSPYSYYDLSDKKITPKVYGAISGFVYTHDGLYTTSAFVTATDKYVLKISASVDDKKMVTDYKNILKTVKIN